MGAETKTGFIGVVTNTADLQAPAGALERATNVVIRRAGCAETRPGVKTALTRAITARAYKILPYESETVYALSDNTWWNSDDNIAILYAPLDGTAAVAPPQFRRDLIPHAQARGNLYIGTGIGVMRFNGVPDPVAGVDRFLVAGLPTVGTFITMGAVSYLPTVGHNLWLPNNSQAAYRVVLARTDANGLTVRSRPSSGLPVVNTSGGAVYIRLVFQWSSVNEQLRYFDTIEVYRTRTFPTSVAPDEEYQRVGSIAAAGITSYNFIDELSDGSRGATLYTSPSREGAEGANYPPPACGAMALFKGALFFGNTKTPARIAIGMNNPFDVYTGSATGFGQRSYTGTTTNGSTAITLMSSTVGLQGGQRVSGPGIVAGTYVTSVAGATVNISQAATASAAVPLDFQDQIWVNGVGYVPFPPSSSVQKLTLDGTSTLPFDSSWQTPSKAGFINTVLLESFTAGGTLSVMASHGEALGDALPLYNSPRVVTGDDFKNGLYWSKPDEPEHAPLGNFAFVGDTKREILALVATRDALFIFKEDGIWRLTGVPGQYRTDPFDLTVQCVLPSSVVPLRNKIYLLCNQGIVSVSDQGGVELISRPIQDQLKQLIYDLALEGSTGGGYVIPAANGIGHIGYAGAASDRDHEYMLMVENALEDQASGITEGILVFNADTQAWTSWRFNRTGTYQVVPSTIAWHDRQSRLLIAQQTDTGVIKALAEPGALISLFNKKYAADADVSMNITGGGTTITYTPAIDMAVGDVVRASDNTLRRVVGVVGSSSVTLDSAAPTGTGRYMRPIVATVRPRPFLAPNQVMKLWAQIVAQFSQVFGVTAMSFGALASVIADTTALVQTPMEITLFDGFTPYMMGAALRGWLPTEGARGYKLSAEVTWEIVLGDAVLEAVMVEAREGKMNAPNFGVSP